VGFEAALRAASASGAADIMGMTERYRRGLCKLGCGA
jgi:hypothetical protein